MLNETMIDTNLKDFLDDQIELIIDRIANETYQPDGFLGSIVAFTGKFNTQAFHRAVKEYPD